MADLLSKIIMDSDLCASLSPWLSQRELCGVLPRVSKLLHSAASTMAPSKLNGRRHAASFVHWVTQQPAAAVRMEELHIDAAAIMPQWSLLHNLRALTIESGDKIGLTWDNYFRLHDADITPLTGLTALTSLCACDHRISTDGACVLAGALCGLRSLDLSFNSGIDSLGALALAKGMPHLTYLNLGTCGIDAAGIGAVATLDNLVNLDLDCNQEIYNAGLKMIGALTNLTTLRCCAIKCTAPGVQGITHLTKLADLSLGCNTIGDEGAEQIARLPGLTALDCSACHICDAGACAIAGMTSLVQLAIMENFLTDHGIRCFSRLTSLQCLWLDGNPDIATASAVAALTSCGCGLLTFMLQALAM